jgi:3-oxoacyl-[acyl-carrier protein] reductase
MLSGRIALITGPADDSIVRSITLSLALHGAKTAIAYTTPKEVADAPARADALVYAAHDLGGEAFALPLSEGEQADAAAAVIQGVLSAYGTVDLLLSRVGAGWDPYAAAQMSTAELDAAVQAEIADALMCIQACLPVMRQNNWGRIVLICPFEPVCWTHGSAAAEARRFMAQQFERHERSHNITLNLIHPGWGVVGPGRAEAALAAARHESTWQHRRTASAQDIADAALFLCGESARFICGSQLFFAME